MSHISLGVSKPKTNPDGYFVANYYREGKARKSKTVSLALHSPEVAYETVDLWAEDLAKEVNVPYQKTSFKALCQRLKMVKEGKTVIGVRSNKVQSSNLGNIKFFKNEMRRAFKEFGADKIREVLKEGTKLLGELQREKIKIEKNSGKAKSDIAKAMYLTFIDTGVDTSIYCNDEDIINEFKQLQLDNQQGEINV